MKRKCLPLGRGLGSRGTCTWLCVIPMRIEEGRGSLRLSFTYLGDWEGEEMQVSLMSLPRSCVTDYISGGISPYVTM